MAVSSIGPYRIIGGLGRGGYGWVHLAEDTRLGRQVAIKTLSALDSQDMADARHWVLREARAAARLNHANIASVYDVIETPEGTHIVMEYVRGETLAARIAAGPLSPRKVVAIAVQLSEALAEAHGTGVIHRDLKPGNVMITPKGQVKILDFGLAKVCATETKDIAAQSSSYSIEGRNVGTRPYMPPEHLLGDPVGVRGDIYSLGVMLFELLTGWRPFHGADGVALSLAILSQPTPRASAANPEVSPALDAVVFRAMSRLPKDRYASASEMAVELRRLAEGSSLEEVEAASPPIGGVVDSALLDAPTVSRAAAPLRRTRTRLTVYVAGLGAFALLLASRLPGVSLAPRPPAHIRSLAVLPLVNLSGDPGQEYFADGMTEALISDLAKISGLRVISRTSAMLYKGERKRLPTIARELGVDAVLEGAVLSSEGRVRISAHLMDGVTERQLWSNSFESELSGVLDLQRNVARATAAEIRVALTPQEDALLGRSRRVVPEALEATLKGRYFWNRRNHEGFLKGLEYFRQAIVRDPSYAPAHAGMADSYLMLVQYGLMPMEEGFPKAKAAAVRAVELDDTLAEAHLSLAAIIEDYDWDWAHAEAEFKRAIALNPGLGPARQWYAEFLAAMGRFEEAVAEATRALELDPLSPNVHTALGRILYESRQYDRAAAALQHALELDPSFAEAHRGLGLVYEKQRRYADAVAEFEKAEALSSGSTQYAALAGQAHAMAGNTRKARDILQRLETRSRSVYVSPADLVPLHLGLRDHDAALRLLENAYEQRLPSMVDLKVDPLMDELRADPRFQQLLRKIGLPP